jgi:uncharacterized protein (TIGR03089 family)
VTPERRFAQLLAADPARPFVTYYDEASGERSELSRASLANWVAKTHHLLVDELGLGVGSRALVALPAHWIAVPVLLGCLTAGLELTSAGDADVAFVSDTSAAAGAGALDAYAVNPARAAVGFGDAAPAGTSDYVTAVRPQADTWAGVAMPADGSAPCLPGLTREAASAAAAERAQLLGLGEGGRLLSTRDWAGPADWLDALFVPLAVGGSLVLVRNAPDEALLSRRAEQERATVTLDR